MSFQWYIWVIIIWIIWGIGAGIANRILEKLEIDEDEVFAISLVWPMIVVIFGVFGIVGLPMYLVKLVWKRSS